MEVIDTGTETEIKLSADAITVIEQYWSSERVKNMGRNKQYDRNRGNVQG